MASNVSVARVPAPGTSPDWDEAVEAFLRRSTSDGTRRQYALTLDAVGARVGRASLRDLTPAKQAANPRTCPHGRPTMIHLGSKQLEREFGRS